MTPTGQTDSALETAQPLDAARIGEELTTPIGLLASSRPVTVSPEATVAEAARAMRDGGASAALVAADPPGILTERDLSTRVLAEERAPDTPVREVMTRPLQTFPETTPVFEALRRMLELGVHHLPVAGDGGEVVSILRDVQLLRAQARGPLPLLDRIQRLDDIADAPADYAAQVAHIAATLFGGGLGVVQIARMLAALSGAFVRRLLVLCERELGPPPCRYAWLALGSEGRMEQVLLSDQDNALVYEAPVDGAPEYFEALAERVVGGLIAAGYPPCPGGYMATNWCMSLERWRELFVRWVELPEPQALLEAQIFFDFRRLHGELELEPLEAILRAAGRQGSFMQHMGRASLSFRPPLGPFGRVRGDDGWVDLKTAGLAAIVMLARVYALAGGAERRPTLERLRAGAQAGTLSRAGAEILGESFRFLMRLRLAAQLASLARGEQATNRIRLDELTPLERRRLAEALRAVKNQQDAAALRFRLPT